MPYDQAWPLIKAGTYVRDEDGDAAVASESPALASKAEDLEALRDTVVDAASVSVGLWLSYLFVLFYFLIAAGGVTQRDLLFENAVKLPFLNVDLPLVGFFVLGPGLFLIVHAYVLIHFTLLADKIGVFHAELQKQIGDDDIRARLRRQLPSNIFVQTLAGPYEVRSGILGFMLRQIAQISLVAAPVALLVFFQLQFLAYHNEAITWWQRASVVADLALIWMFWPSIARGEAIAMAWSNVRPHRIKIIAMAVTTAVPILLVFVIATFPGELLDKLPTIRVIPWKFKGTTSWKRMALHELLVAGEVDFSTRRAASLWTNRLVLPGLDVIDHSKFDSDEKIANMPSPISLRARHLEGAVLIGATLRRVDFTGAWMQNATLGASDLREAIFECDTARQSGPDGPEYRCTQLQGASFVGSRLQASSFVGAQLGGALFYRAHLQGASFLNAVLDGAALDSADLQGVTFDSAHLRGASLVGAQLQGAVLDSAELEAASLDSAQLQGATLDGAKLDFASLRKVFAWRADVQKASVKGVRADAETGAQESCLGLVTIVRSDSSCNWSADSFLRLKQMISDKVPKGAYQRDALSRIQKLDPAQSLDGDAQMAETWRRLKTASPSLEAYETGKAAVWQQIGCDDPYVLRGLVTQMGSGDVAFSPEGNERAQLAKAFGADDCKAERDLSELELAVLMSVRDSKTASSR